MNIRILLITIILSSILSNVYCQNLSVVSNYKNEYQTVGNIPEIEKSYLFILESNYDDALISINTQIQDNPNNLELYYYRAVCHYNNGQLYDANLDIGKYLNSSSQQHLYDSYVIEGNINAKKLSYELAIKSYNKAIAKNKSRRIAYVEKARTYLSWRNYQSGLSFLNKSIKKNPDEYELYHIRSRMNLALGNSKKAYSDLQLIISKANEVSPNLLSQAYIGIAGFYLQKKQYDMAEKSVENAIDIVSINAAYGLLGEIKYLNGDFSGSLTAFNKFIDGGGANSRYYLMMAESYESIGNITMACRFYGFQLEMFPDDTKIQDKVKKLNCAN